MAGGIIETPEEARRLCKGPRYLAMRRRVFAECKGNGSYCEVCGSTIDWTLSGRDRMGAQLDHIEPWTCERQVGRTVAEATAALLTDSHCRVLHAKCNAHVAGLDSRHKFDPARNPAVAEVRPNPSCNWYADE